MTGKADKRPTGPQVDAAHYAGGYDSLYRWVSYWYQLRELRRLRPARVLEIGVGNGTVSAALARDGAAVTTLDFDPKLRPDVCGDVRQLGALREKLMKEKGIGDHREDGSHVGGSLNDEA